MYVDHKWTRLQLVFCSCLIRWDYAVIDTLPDYMKMYYRALLDTTNDIAQGINEKNGYNPINSLKAAVNFQIQKRFFFSFFLFWVNNTLHPNLCITRRSKYPRNFNIGQNNSS